MIKTTKRLVAILLVVVMAMSSFPMVAFAATEYVEGNYTYTVSDSKATIVSYPETAEGVVNIPKTLGGYPVTAIGAYAFYGCTLITEISIPASITSIGNKAFDYCIYLEVVNYGGTEAQWKKISIGSGNDYLINAEINYNVVPNTDIYNLGEETYRFGNFVDGDSFGHCFGMSMTSSGYYNNLLNIADVGGNNITDVYGLRDNTTTRGPICHYQNIQGSKASKAMVAGGRAYKFLGILNIKADWREVVAYVKNHQYDDKGTLQIGYRKTGEGGHAINFLRYAVIDGQERIYAYDNNFPDTETYFYMSSDGKVYQAPYQTFSGAIDSICLRDIFIYFDNAEDFDSSRVIYGDTSQISISDADIYLMDCAESGSNYAMFELPEDAAEVNIKPLVDNASFKYVGEEYSFGAVNDDTVGVFTLATSEETAPEEADLAIVDSSFNIQDPSRTEIRNKNGIILHMKMEDAPEDSYVVWSSNNRNFDTDDLGDGKLEIIAKNKGWTTFTATLYDADGKIIGKDTVEMYSKSGLFDKIGGFFRSLFGTTKIYDK